VDLDIGIFIDEHVDKLIETLDILEPRVIEIADDDDLLDIVVEALAWLDSIEIATLRSIDLEES
jgi:hypothetical protein